MFLGQFQHNLDEKGRLMIPAPYRQTLEDGAYIMQGFDRCLMVMTKPYFEQVYERINSMNLADPATRLLRRMILSTAYPVDLDIPCSRLDYRRSPDHEKTGILQHRALTHRV